MLIKILETFRKISEVSNDLDRTLRYAPDNSWYILTMNEVFELGGSLVREVVAHNLMRLLAEGGLHYARK